MTNPSLRTLLFATLAVAVTTVLGGAAMGQGAAELVERRLLDLERRLLAEDLAELELARLAAVAASGTLDDLAVDLSAANRAGSAPTRLAPLEQAVAEGQEAQRRAAARVDQALAAVGDRLRRIRLLALAAGTGGEEVIADTLSGRWEVVVMPGPVTGAIHLDQSGTLVAGSYRFADGSRGSLEGTLVAGLLRLRRIDVASGFDSLFEAEVDPLAGRLDGRWQATILGRGGAGGGSWSAVRVPPDAGDEPDSDLLPGPEDPATGPQLESVEETDDRPTAEPEEASPTGSEAFR